MVSARTPTRLTAKGLSAGDRGGLHERAAYATNIRVRYEGEAMDFDLGDLNFWKWDVGAAFRF